MHESIWYLTLTEEQRGRLAIADELPKSAEVAIVGAGLIGLSIAYYLVKAGVTDICVMDRRHPLAEASGANAGGLWAASDSPHMGPLLPLAKASNALYDQLAEELSFDLIRSGILQLVHTSADFEEVSADVARARKAGFEVLRLGRQELTELEPGLNTTAEAAVLFPTDGQLNPAKLGTELVRVLRAHGVRICPEVEVVRAGSRIETSKGTLDAGITVIASGAWTPLVTRVLGWEPPIKPIRGQLVAVGPMAPVLRHTVMAEEFYYWQLPGGYVAGGGTMEDVGFERGVEQKDLLRIRSEMDRLVPVLEGVATARAWYGFRPFCKDQLPVIGPVPGHEGTFVAAGHFRKGVMLSPVTGKIVADLLVRGKTDLPVEEIRPERFPGCRG